MGDIVTALDIHIIALILAVAMLATWSIGRRMGERLLHKSGTKPSKFDDVSMALLSLQLAFSFGMSIAKHDQRRLAVVADSNAIGDFYTCASLLEGARANEVTGRYTAIRASPPISGSQCTSQFRPRKRAREISQLHTQMTEIVEHALTDGTPIAVSLTNTLNAVTSNQASRLAAYRDRLPASILYLLFACSIVTVRFIGREQGATPNSDIAGTLCFIFLVSIAVYVTLDLNLPEGGLIRVSQEPIERLLSSMPK